MRRTRGSFGQLVLGLLCMSCALQAESGAAETKTPITVDDLLRFAAIGDPKRLDWYGRSSDAGQWSPQGSQVAIVLRTGNLPDGTNDARLWVYSAHQLLTHAVPIELARFASSSNYQPMAFVRWLDERTVVFAATQAAQRSQIYRVNLDTRQLEQLTFEQSQLVWYDITASGSRLLTLAEPGKTPPAADPSCQQRGCRVTSTHLYRQEAGIATGSKVLTLHDLISGHTHELPNPETELTSLTSCQDEIPGGLSPDGRFAIRVCQLGPWPEPWWHEYVVAPRLRSCYERSELDCARVLVLIDLQSGMLRVLNQAPFVYADDLGQGSIVWIDSGRHFLHAGALEPLGDVSEPERALRSRSFAVLSVDPLTGSTTRIARLAPEIERISTSRWDDRSQTLCVIASNTRNRPQQHCLQRTDGRWIDKPPMLSTENKHVVELTLRQSLREPPRLFARNRITGVSRLVLDPNPWLRERKIGQIEAISWKVADDLQWRGAIYYPPDHIPTGRYPLLIQTHGLEPDFSLNGETPNFPGQALAAHGILVVQVAEKFGWSRLGTPREMPTARAGYEALIDYLDGRGLIDKARVGAIGWSRTGPQVGYLLTHSEYPIAAAAFTDSGDFGWLWYLSQGAPPIDSLYGGAPFGASLKGWLESSPTFNLQRVRTPMLMWEANGALPLWDWYVGLRRLQKPVEYWVLPEGVHQLFKISERKQTNQLLVDWFRFWLKDEEDSNPAKGDQYKRWRQLKVEQEKVLNTGRPPLLHWDAAPIDSSRNFQTLGCGETQR